MIVFKKIRFKNFGSFGNYWTEIDLNGSSSSLVIGLNGHGKSFALFDSITFALFGKPFRNINKPNLVNSINRKNCVVEVEFETSPSKAYKIVRGIAPAVFEIYENGILLNQQAASKDYQQILEENILKMTHKSFCQVVILGSTNYVPFMQLPAADRRAVIEDLLDIQVFSIMNAILKDQMIELRENELATKQAIEVSLARYTEISRSLDALRQKDQQHVESLQEQITSIENDVSALNKAYEKVDTEISGLLNITSTKSTLSAELKELTKLITTSKKNAELLTKTVAFYEQNDRCPTCKQEISLTLKEEVFKEKKAKKQISDELLKELNETIHSIESQIAQIEETEKQLRTLEHDRVLIFSQIQSKESAIKELNEDIISRKTSKDDLIHTKEIEAEVANQELVVSQSKLDSIRITKQYQEVAAILLKDSGIKSRIVKKHLPTINRLINYYLNKLDFFVSFELDENFKETIKSRHRDEFLYTSFSQGEKMRIDLAILLTWREIAKQKNKVNTNLLLLDEVFDSSLDSFGVDEFIKILTAISTWNQDTNIFVITHRTDGFSDKFNTTLKFEKRNDFTYMNVINNTTA